MSINPSAGLAGQLRVMTDFAAVRDLAALGRVWPDVSAISLPIVGIPGIMPLGAGPKIKPGGLDEFRKKVLDRARPALDTRVLRFVEQSRPLSGKALLREGFDSAEGAIMLVDRARNRRVLSRDPSEALIASALDLVFSEDAEKESAVANNSKRASTKRFLQADDRLSLINAAKDGHSQAMERLIYHYRPMILNAARSARQRFGLSESDSEDLFQRGCIRFAELVMSFDPDRGSSFGAYTKRFVLLDLLNFASHDRSVVYRPAHYRKALLRMYAARWQLQGELGRRPDDGELAARLGVDPNALRQDQIDAVGVVSLFASLPNSVDMTYEDIISSGDSHHPDNRTLCAELNFNLDSAIDGSGLDRQEISVLRMLYLEGYTVKDVGRALGLENLSVRELVRSAMKKIAAGPFADQLRELMA